MKPVLKKTNRILFCLCVVSGLISCAAGEQKTVPRPDTVITRIVDINAVESDCGGLLIYYDSLTQLNRSELAKEKEILKRNRKESKNHCIELRYVLFSLLPETGMKNDTEVNRIVDQLLSRKAKLQRDERQLLELLADQLELSTRERDKNKLAESQIKKLKAELTKEKEKTFQLQKQLSEVELKLKMLKTIEEKINAKEKEITTPSTNEKAP